LMFGLINPLLDALPCPLITVDEAPLVGAGAVLQATKLDNKAPLQSNNTNCLGVISPAGLHAERRIERLSS